MKLSGVILDLDGVLIDTESISKRAWVQAAEEFGFIFSDLLYSKIAGRSVLSARREIEEETEGFIDLESYIERSTFLYNEEMNCNGVQMMIGVLELLEFLDQAKLSAAIATSTSRFQADRKLDRSGLQGKIKVIVTGDQIENGKPAPDLFLLAAQKISTPPSQCVVIEDAEAGIIGAKSAGMIPIMVSSTIGPSTIAKNLSYAIVPSLHEVLEIIRDLVE